MSNELKNAIKIYASMLPYPNTGASPHDDPRLFKIAKLSHDLKEPISEDYFKECLEENNSIGIHGKQLQEFVENRLSKIEEVKYIIGVLKKID